MRRMLHRWHGLQAAWWCESGVKNESTHALMIPTPDIQQLYKKNKFTSTISWRSGASTLLRTAHPSVFFSDYFHRKYRPAQPFGLYRPHWGHAKGQTIFELGTCCGTPPTSRFDYDLIMRLNIIGKDIWSLPALAMKLGRTPRMILPKLLLMVRYPIYPSCASLMKNVLAFFAARLIAVAWLWCNLSSICRYFGP